MILANLSKRTITVIQLEIISHTIVLLFFVAEFWYADVLVYPPVSYLSYLIEDQCRSICLVLDSRITIHESFRVVTASVPEYISKINLIFLHSWQAPQQNHLSCDHSEWVVSRILDIYRYSYQTKSLFLSLSNSQNVIFSSLIWRWDIVV